MGEHTDNITKLLQETLDAQRLAAETAAKQAAECERLKLEKQKINNEVAQVKQMLIELTEYQRVIIEILRIVASNLNHQDKELIKNLIKNKTVNVLQSKNAVLGDSAKIED